MDNVDEDNVDEDIVEMKDKAFRDYCKDSDSDLPVILLVEEFIANEDEESVYE